MSKVTPGQKEVALQMICSSNPPSIKEISEKTGINTGSLYYMRRQALGTTKRSDPNDTWTIDQKLDIVVKSITMNELEFGEFCRENGLLTDQVQQWKDLASSGFVPSTPQNPNLANQLRESQAEVRQLNATVRKHEKTIAELAAIVTMLKKVEAIWV